MKSFFGIRAPVRAVMVLARRGAVAKPAKVVREWHPARPSTAFVLSALLALIAGCEAAGGERLSTPGEALNAGSSEPNGPLADIPAVEDGVLGRDTLSTGAAGAITAAARAYILERTAIREVSIEIEAATASWVRVRAVPSGGATDPATLYLRWANGRWEVVALGTGFTPDDLDGLGVPRAVRPRGS
jgi:hypothetical protein